MKPEEYQVMYDVEDTHWWYVGMRSIFLSLLDGHYGARSDLHSLPPAINRSLAQVLFLERWLLRKIDLPFGLSVVCVARK